MPELTTLDKYYNDDDWVEPTDDDLRKIEQEEEKIMDKLSDLIVAQGYKIAQKSKDLLDYCKL